MDAEFKIPHLFGEENYKFWAIQMKSYLTLQDLLHCISSESSSEDAAVATPTESSSAPAQPASDLKVQQRLKIPRLWL